MTQKEYRYRTLFEAAYDSIFILEDYRFVECNRTTLKMFGCEEKTDILGFYPWDFSPPYQPDGQASKEKAIEMMDISLAGRPQKFYWKHIQKDGSPFDTEVSLNRLETKGTHALQAIVRDVTEHKLIETMLRQSQEKYRSFIDNAPVGMYTLNTKGEFTYGNKKLLEMTGYKTADWLNKPFHPIVHPDDLDLVLSKVLDRLAGRGKTDPYEIRIFHASGKIMWVKISSESIYVTDEKGDKKLIGMQSFVEDVTERKHFEQALFASEERLRSIFDSVNAGIVIIDPKSHTIVDVNPYAANLIGTVKNNIIGRECHCFICPAEKGKCPITDLGDDVDSSERILLTADGQNIPILKTVIPVILEGSQHLLESFIEITQWKQAETALRSERDRAQMYLDVAGVILVALDTDGKVVLINKKGCQILGYKENEILGNSWFDHYIPLEQRVPVKDVFQKLMRGLIKPVEYFENPVITKKGKSRQIAWYNTLLKDQGGAIIGTLSSGEDITERKKVEQALRDSENRFRAIFDNANDGILLADIATQKFHLANKMICEMLGYTQKELMDLKVTDIHPQEDLTRVLNHFEKQAREDLSLVKDIPMKRKDGSVLYADINAFLITLGDHKYLAGIFRDMTEHKRVEKALHKMENQLRLAQRMEAIGNLAGGIAHDFNNILTPIMVRTEMALSEISTDYHVKTNLEHVLKAGIRAKELVQHILTFSRQSEDEKKPLKMGPIIKEALRLLRATLPTTIEIQQHIETGSDMILASPVQIHQILMNLCTNAAHAMREKGGVLQVSLSNITIKDDSSYPDLKPGAYILMEVKDTGHGMEYRIMEQIFDPFFTTKERGEGTGMGLAVVHGIVKSYGGTISVDSELAKGTTFQIFFPRIEATVVEKLDVAKTLARGNERILLIDDEQSIVAAVTQMLQRLGYFVDTSGNAVEALEKFRSAPYRFDLVITDQTMPKMTGMELAKEILQIRPEIPIILCTGFSELVVEENIKAMGIRDLVFKPILRSEIAQTIRRALEEE